MADGILVAARLLAFVLMMLVAGVPIYRLTEGRQIAGQMERKALALLAVGAVALSGLWALASVAAMAASSITALDRATVQAVLAATPLGAVLLIRAGALAAMLLTALAFPRNTALAALGTVALATSAWTGHAGSGEGTAGAAHQLADVIHLVAAATWLGALACFLEQSFRRGNDLDRVRALSRFARTGTAIVALLAVTGVANAWFVTAASGWSPRSGWSLLIAVKVALFFAMLGLAASNRWCLVPALEAAQPGARQRLARSLLLETGCALGIVALVAFAGVLDPSGA